MKSQAFLTSGILEKYVLGMVTEEEASDVQEMVSQHLEVKEELVAIRKTIRAYILNHQVTPGGGLKAKVMNVTTTRSAPDSRSTNSIESTALPSYRAKKKSESNFNLAGILAGLFGLALVAVGYMAFSFQNDADTAKAELAKSTEQITALNQQQEAQQKTEQQLQENLSFYTDRSNKAYQLKGTRRAVSAAATLYWNGAEKKAFIDVAKMPSLADGKVAVLWVKGNSNALKAGVLKSNEAGKMSTLTYIESPKLFFVTEEINGNVDRPNRRKILMTATP